MDLLTWDERSILTDNGYLPTPAHDRLEKPTEPIDLVGRYRGVLVGLGIGDALAKPIQQLHWRLIEQRHGYVNRYLSAPIDQFMLPPGQLTDDTQQAIMLADSLASGSRLAPADVVKRFEAFLPVARTAGAATLGAIRSLRNGTPWTHTGLPSAGNGALARAVVPPLLHPFDLDAIRTSEAIHTVITHADHSAVAASVATGAVISHLLATPTGRLSPVALHKAIERAMVGVTDPVVSLRTEAASATLAERLALAIDAPDLEPHQAYEKFGCGGFVLEALPLALWAFVAHADDPIATVVLAVSAGGASSTIGALAGAFAGAYHGVGVFPDAWIDHLEYVDGLTGHADRLAERAGLEVPAPIHSRDPLLPSAYAPFSLGGSIMPTLEHAIRSSSAPDPTTSVKVRLVPTPADARRMAMLSPVRDDWVGAAPGLVSAILRRKFADGQTDTLRLTSASTAEVHDAARCMHGEPFDYAALLEEHRSSLAVG